MGAPATATPLPADSTHTVQCSGFEKAKTYGCFSKQPLYAPSRPKGASIPKVHGVQKP